MASCLVTRFRLALGLLALVILPRAAAADAWDLFTNANNLESVAAIDGYVYTSSLGGAQRFDPATGAFLRYRREPGGIGSNHVVEVAKDPSGVLWFATNDAGASLLEGDFWVPVAEFEGIPSLDVTALEPYRDGMWVGTDKGLAFFKGTTIDAVWPDGANPSPFQSNVIRDVTSIVGRTWVATDNGVYSTVAGVTWDSLSTNLTTRDVVSLAHDGTTLWAVSANGAVWKGGETGSWSPAGTGLTSNAVRLATRNGTLVLGAVNGVWRWDPSGSTWTPLGGPASARPEVADDGTIWAGNRQGLWRWDGSTWAAYRSQGPLDNWITGIALQGSTLYTVMDNRFNIGAGGVSRYDDVRGWRGFVPGADPDTSLLSNNFFFLCAVDGRGDKWLGDWGGSIARLDDSGPVPQVTHFFRDTLVFTYGWSFGDDPLGYKWIGLDTGCRGCPGQDPQGLLRIDADGTRTNFKPSNSAMTSVQIRSIAFAPDGTMWVGYADFGVDVFSNRTLNFRNVHLAKTVSQFNPQLRSDNVWSIVFSGTTAWILTDGGIARYSTAGGTPQYAGSVSTPEMSATGAVNPLVVDAQGGAWVASKRGLYRINSDGSTALYNTANSPLASNDVHSLALDATTGALWIATQDGLNRLRPSELSAAPTAASRDLLVSPNPLALAGSGTAFRITAADGTFFAHTPIEIRDVRGRVVASLRSDGRGYAAWNGTTATGRRLPAGVYFVRLVGYGVGGAPEALAQARLVLLP